MRTIQRDDITTEVKILMSMSSRGLGATVAYCHRNSSCAGRKDNAVDTVLYLCNTGSAVLNYSGSLNLWQRLQVQASR